MATSAAKGQVFVWQGTDRQGRSTKGEIESISLAMAIGLCRPADGLLPFSIARKAPVVGDGTFVAALTSQPAVGIRRGSRKPK